MHSFSPTNHFLPSARFAVSTAACFCLSMPPTSCRPRCRSVFVALLWAFVASSIFVHSFPADVAAANVRRWDVDGSDATAEDEGGSRLLITDDGRLPPVQDGTEHNEDGAATSASNGGAASSVDDNRRRRAMSAGGNVAGTDDRRLLDPLRILRRKRRDVHSSTDAPVPGNQTQPLPMHSGGTPQKPVVDAKEETKWKFIRWTLLTGSAVGLILFTVFLALVTCKCCCYTMQKR